MPFAEHLLFLCVCEKDTFPGKSPDEVAVVYQELREPAEEKKNKNNEKHTTNRSINKNGIKAYSWHNLYLYFIWKEAYMGRWRY